MNAARSVEVEIALESHTLAAAVAGALEVERNDSPPKTSIQVAADGPLLRIRIDSEETRGLRAAVNSYLRWADAAIAVARIATRV